MKFGYAIVYVNDVVAATKFYQAAFGIGTRFLHEGGDYAELETGATTLALAAHSLGETNFPSGYTKLTDLEKPAGIEIAFLTEQVQQGVSAALAAGAALVSPPTLKPWGQTVAYVRAPDGTLIELCTPMSNA